MIDQAKLGIARRTDAEIRSLWQLQEAAGLIKRSVAWDRLEGCL